MQETQEMWVWSLGRDATLENEMKLALVFLPRKSHGLEGYSPEGCKEYDMT